MALFLFDIKITVLNMQNKYLEHQAQLRLWPPPQNLAEFLGSFSTIN
jgi:hypothetical protein